MSNIKTIKFEYMKRKGLYSSLFAIFILAILAFFMVLTVDFKDSSLNTITGAASCWQKGEEALDSVFDSTRKDTEIPPSQGKITLDPNNPEDAELLKWMDEVGEDEVISHTAGSTFETLGGESRGGRFYESGVMSTDEWRKATMNKFNKQKEELIEAYKQNPENLEIFPEDSYIHMTSSKNMEGISESGLKGSSGVEGSGVYTAKVNDPEKLGGYATSASVREGASPVILRVDPKADVNPLKETPGATIFSDLPPDKVQYWDSTTRSWKEATQWKSSGFSELPSENSLKAVEDVNPNIRDNLYGAAQDNNPSTVKKYRELRTGYGLDEDKAKKIVIASEIEKYEPSKNALENVKGYSDKEIRTSLFGDSSSAINALENVKGYSDKEIRTSLFGDSSSAIFENEMYSAKYVEYIKRGYSEPEARRRIFAIYKSGNP